MGATMRKPTANDAGLDKDSDGQSNLAEYRAGTNPGDARSLLRVVSATASPSGPMTISWSSVVGKVYRVMHATALSGWTEVPGTRRLATGIYETAVFAEPAPGARRAFFRVELMVNN